MKDREKAKEIAQERMKLIAPLITPGVDSAMARSLKKTICRESGLSSRTITRYLNSYHQEGFDGLMPRQRISKSPGAISPEVLEEAILLRKQVPERSIAQIIRILEWEGRVTPGQIKRSTLQDHMMAKGYSSRQMKQYHQSGTAARRFVRSRRNQLWQSDIKFGPFLPIGKDGKKKQVYLVTFLDDATRFILHSAFYDSLEKAIVIDSFRQAILRHGIPEAVYFDNGTQYRNKWMQETTGRLGTRLLFARPYHAEGKGKVERYNQVVDSFLAEARLENIQTLEDLNSLYMIWLEECYLNQPHSELKEQKTPLKAYREDPHPVRFADPASVQEAFLHREKRKVNKIGCLSFQGKTYEAGMRFLGRTVDIVYDPADTTRITVEAPGLAPVRAAKVVIGDHVGAKIAVPEQLNPETVSSSRLLEAAKRKNREKEPVHLPVISYLKAGECDV